MHKHFNIIGPQVRRLRNARNWSQNNLAIKLQILGMENASRVKVGKIESRLVWIADEDLIYLARALGVSTEQLYPDFIRGAKRLYDAICASKASRFGALVIGALGCSQLGTSVREIAANIANV